MKRRTFLKSASAVAALSQAPQSLASCVSSFDQRVSPCRHTPLGVQLFTLRELLPTGVGKVLSEVSTIGYEEVELFGLGFTPLDDKPLFGMSAKEFRATLEGAGLSAPIAHIGGQAAQLPQLAELALAAGVDHLVLAVAPDLMSLADNKFRFVEVTGRDQLDRIAEHLNRLGELAKSSGIGFGYHNHHMEFARLDAGNAFDYLFSQVDPALVSIELDLGWTIVAGVDPVDVLRRYGNRVIAVHLKDHNPRLPVGDAGRYSIPELPQIVEPGAGPTDFSPILAQLDQIGVRHRFVEIDAAPDPLGAIQAGYRYLAAL